MVLDGEAVLGKQPQELVEPSCVSKPDFDVGIATRVHESSDDFDLVGVIDYPLNLLLGSLIELHELDDVSFIGSFVTKPANRPRQPEILHATRSVHLPSLSHPVLPFWSRFASGGGALRNQMGGFRYLPSSGCIIVPKDDSRQTERLPVAATDRAARLL